MTLLADIAAASQRVAKTSSRLAKARELAGCLRTLQPDEIPIAIAFLSGETRQGKLGISYAALRAALAVTPAEQPSLALREVDAAFARQSAIRAKGAAALRVESLTALFARATAPEQDFLARLIAGELRQGALKALVLEAVALASGIDLAEARKAVMSAGGIGEVARVMLTEGRAGLARFAVRLMQPVLPMLSQSADDTDAALRQLGTAAFEWKLDGARVQVHKAGGDVRVYTRNLNDVTARVPEVVELARSLPAASLILDGEVIALRPNGAPHSFQLTMRRFGRKLEVDAMRQELPLSVFFFDCLLRDGAPLTDRPAAERFAALADALPAENIIARLVTDDAAQAAEFFQSALRHGHEGVVAKALDAPYEAGRRGAGWLKIKRANTLDLVVLAAEWGHGRRSGRLSNLHLGARDPTGNGYVMLGKTFKGLTDEMLEWQTREFLKLETGRDSWTVYMRPEIVVEVAFNEVQASSQYPGGLALRFARVKGYRPDKRADEVDSIDTVRSLYAAQADAGATS
jgi:DNA ligase-1